MATRVSCVIEFCDDSLKNAAHAADTGLWSHAHEKEPTNSRRTEAPAAWMPTYNSSNCSLCSGVNQRTDRLPGQRAREIARYQAVHDPYAARESGARH